MRRETDREMGTEMNRTKRVIKYGVKYICYPTAFCAVVFVLQPVFVY
jgi:hypothetical protein